MNYWVISPNVNADYNNLAVWKQAIVRTNRAFIGWQTDNEQGRKFANEMEIGDLILISRGPNDNKELLMCGVVATNAVSEELEDTPSYAQNRRLHTVLSAAELQAQQLDFSGCAYGDADRIPALYKLHPERNSNDKRICEQLSKLISEKSKEKEMQNAINLLKNKGQIILQGPPGTGKTRRAKELAAQLTAAGGESKLIQFHPSYAYEDFVRGIVAEPVNGGNGVAYTVRNKILAAFAAKAEADPNHPFVLIIDEINRANLSAVLGELLYALEYRYDAKAEETQKREAVVESPYGVKAEGSDAVDYELRLPKNLLIIGTMNTADRSAGSLDYAIRRRFAFVEVGPDESAIPTETGKTLFRKVAALFEGKESFLSPEFRKEDVQPGHSYFMEVEGGLPLADRLKYEIQPLLHEYLRDGILLPTANNAAEKTRTAAEEAIAALRAE